MQKQNKIIISLITLVLGITSLGFPAKSLENSDSKEKTFLKNIKQLTVDGEKNGEAYFSPDRKKIVFTSQRDEDFEIYIMDADGKNQKRLTSTNGINWCPAFHPDGKHIIFSSNMNDPNNFELYIMDIDGENLRQITFNKTSDVLPYFSSDGKKLLWTSTRADGKSQIFVSDFNTSVFNEPSKYQSIYKDLKFLSSDELEGRRSGTPGSDKAAQYISEKFKSIGLKPAGTGNSYFQNFDVTVGINLGSENYLRVKQPDGNFYKAEISKDFTPVSFSDNGNIIGDLVFAGYGITAPEYNYDDYKGIDVKGKIVVILRHEPQEKDEKSVFNGNKPTPHSSLRYKSFNAKKKGAKAVILINGPVNYTEQEDNLTILRISGGVGNQKIPFIHAKDSFIETLFKDNSFDLKGIQASIDKDLKPDSFSLKKEINLSVDLKREVKQTSNVIGIIEGKDKILKNEVILIGAHYDHLGYGGDESLLTSKDPDIHNGADDNASGTASIIEIARHFAGKKTNRTIAFIAFSGEELGLLGSSYFTNNPTLRNIVTMLNIDMVGRLEDNKLFISGVKTSDIFADILEKANINFGFKMRRLFNDGYGPSDHMSFYIKNIPVLFFFTGVHNDYHKPSDDYYKINFMGMNKIINFINDIVNIIDKNPDSLKSKKTG